MDYKRIKPLKVPVYRDSGFRLESGENTKQAFEAELEHQREPGMYIYSRYRNPTVVAVEEKFMVIEQSSWTLLAQSGMAAIDIALSVFQESGDSHPWLFFSEIYGGTNSFIDQILIRRRGMNIHRFSPDGDNYNLEQLDRTLETLKPRILYFEAISNPMLIVSDAREIIRLAKKHGCVVIVDNTFSTPYLWKPLADGADLVIHSATKYLSGHGDLTAGLLSGNNRDLEKAAIEYRKYIGHMISPDDAWRLGVQLTSFELRMERHCANAARIASFLEKHPAVEKVYYPGLLTHPTHAIAQKLFGDRGFGGMITFDVKGKNDITKREKRDTLIALLSEHIPLIPSLGDAQSTLLPIEPVWGDKFPLPGMIRLSVGIEDVNLIEKRLHDALNNL
jgi:cystathionine beta-lyase/cystathionine gamma-synthase